MIVMRKIKMNNKNLVEYLVGKLVVFILEVAIGIGLILGFFCCIGMLEQFMETHTWTFIIMAIVAIASIFKMASEAE